MSSKRWWFGGGAEGYPKINPYVKFNDPGLVYQIVQITKLSNITYWHRRKHRHGKLTLRALVWFRAMAIFLLLTTICLLPLVRNY